jgi:Transglycosylase SLT domain
VRYACAAAAILLAGCSPRAEDAPVTQPGTLAARREIWRVVQPLALAQRIDPAFVYALVKAESNFDARAQRGEARGLLQIKPLAWAAASPLPYEPGVWDWRTNLWVGVGMLASDKRSLEGRNAFSYPLLWASHHYGFDYVEARGFDIGRIRPPSDPVSFRLFTGEVHPVPLPR